MLGLLIEHFSDYKHCTALHYNFAQQEKVIYAFLKCNYVDFF